MYDNTESSKIGTSLWSDTSGIRWVQFCVASTINWRQPQGRYLYGSTSRSSVYLLLVKYDSEGNTWWTKSYLWQMVCSSHWTRGLHWRNQHTGMGCGSDLWEYFTLCSGESTHDTKIDHPGRDFKWSSTYKFSVNEWSGVRFRSSPFIAELCSRLKNMDVSPLQVKATCSMYLFFFHANKSFILSTDCATFKHMVFKFG